MTSEGETERAGIASFGRSVAIALGAASEQAEVDLVGQSAERLRSALLSNGRPWVGLEDLLALSWSVGIPVAHLRVFPWSQKRMAAMTVRVAERNFILLGKDATYPAWIAFYVAHELAHVALAHLAPDQAVVDLEREEAGPDDAEEAAADTWALELLTGLERPTVNSLFGDESASELARVALGAGPELGIEPGTLALLYGHTTRSWAIANASLRRIYSSSSPVWRAINGYARRELRLDEVSPDVAEFVDQVLALDDVD